MKRIFGILAFATVSALLLASTPADAKLYPPVYKDDTKGVVGCPLNMVWCPRLNACTSGGGSYGSAQNECETRASTTKSLTGSASSIKTGVGKNTQALTPAAPAPAATDVRKGVKANIAR